MRVDKIRELVKIVQESGIGELEITSWWGKRIRIRKNGLESAASNIPVYPEIRHEPSKPTPPPVAETASLAREKVESGKELIEFKSPMVGTFYRAPAPDAEPYIREGDSVSPGKVLCIIEAMKLMNEIEAEVSGRIAQILVENGQPVEYNQPLFLIAP
ncbi:acetyl-CoA carboxylase biotin carboxyl carrier protein [candidate division KSB1 bacterium]|nr:acetyl-CoA carboxylase biotin carboxyl carrier protein [candidate division KSB1 bacterium]